MPVRISSTGRLVFTRQSGSAANSVRASVASRYDAPSGPPSLEVVAVNRWLLIVGAFAVVVLIVVLVVYSGGSGSSGGGGGGY